MYGEVTILVLLDYVLQFPTRSKLRIKQKCHNPCFIRLCFAIDNYIPSFCDGVVVTILVLLDYVLQ